MHRISANIGYRWMLLVGVGVLSCLGGAIADSHATAADPQELSVERLTANARKSVVVISVAGRDGRQHGLGSGFVVSADGLIATNLHVVGEARPIEVQTEDGKKFNVTAVEAFDRPLDLALVRIDAKDLTPLPLGNSAALAQGQAVVALGNPQGLRHSVVAGIVSGTREIDGRQMIQLAIPIEPGNSGGPVLDMFGRVQAIVTMKSAVTENLGFAMPVNALKPLLEKPNPTTIAQWLTIGALDPHEWTPLFGARWRQRAGRILVDGLGNGFGNRSLCLAQTPPPEPPFEIAVSVKLDREEGAAGLVFCADGGNVHYGFYPSGGKLRLSRFDGPDVFSWKVLAEVGHVDYRPGDWNHLKVRFEPGGIRCLVNDRTAIESSDRGLTAGKVGLAKFRTTEAEFRGFLVAKEIPPTRLSDDVVARIASLAENVGTGEASRAELAGRLAAEGAAGVAVLRDRARQMEHEARDLRRLAQTVHQRRVRDELVKALAPDEAQIDLFRAALLVAQFDNEEVDVDGYCRELDRMARDVSAATPAEADGAAKLTALNRYLFEERGFHGSRGDYYHRSNSYVNEVLDDREGLPITLAVIYLELANRLGLPMVGVGSPGHFLVRYEPNEGAAQLIDVFERGQTLSTAEAEARVRDATGRLPREADFASSTKRVIIARMLRNLLGLAQKNQDADAMLRYVDCLAAVAPDPAPEIWMRAVLLVRAGRREEALADIDWLAARRPEGIDLDQVEELRRVLERTAR